MVMKMFRRAVGRLLPGDPAPRFQRLIFREVRRGLPLAQEGFPGTLALPERYGLLLPERVVELQLVRTTYVPGIRVLDIGHANIMECHRRLLESLPPPRRITGIDIAEPVYDTRALYERSILADITATGLPAASFDCIWCVSTLEHVGMDNSGYTNNFSVGQTMDRSALLEMVRLLAPGGTLLITVPFGRFEDLGWMRNYDSSRWHDLLAAVSREVRVHELYFGYSPERGWEMVPAASLSSTGYATFDNAGAGGLAAAVIRKAPEVHEATR